MNTPEKKRYSWQLIAEGKLELNTDFVDCLDVRTVDGQKCVVLPISSMKINGICVKDRVSENEV